VGRRGGSEASFELMDAVFEFFQVVQTRLKAVERFDNVGKTLVFLLTADARLHPAVEGPDGEDDNPEFHGASGPGSAGHVFDTESLQGFAQSVVNPLSAGWRINYDARKPVLARARARRGRAAEQRCAGPETLRLGISDTPWLPVRRPGLTAQSCTKVRTR